MEAVKAQLDAVTARWELEMERKASDVFQRAIDRMPAPKDGAQGADGLGFDDFDVEYDGERKFTFKWANGDRAKSKSFRAPVNIWRGVFAPTASYEKDDSVTYGGSTWIALKDAPGIPGSGDGWRLCVKRGRDAKRDD